MNRLNRTSLMKSILLGIIAILIVGCSSNSESENAGEGEVKQGGEAVVGYLTDISSYDPLKGSSGGDHALLWPVFDTLIKFTPELEPIPGLAESWDFEDDTTLVLHLREGVTFHDGTPFNAEAVKFNIERANSEESNVSDLENVESVEIVDDNTVKLHLKEPDSSLLLALSDRGGMMVSPTAYEEDPENFTQNPIGAGPFKMINRVPNGEIVFEAFEDYWDEGKPYLDKLIVKIISDENARLNALKSGEVDFAFNFSPNNIEHLKSDANLIVDESSHVAFRMIYLNTSMEPFDNKEFRLAVQHAIDRESLILGVNLGLGAPAHQPFPNEYWASDNNLNIEYDPEKAKSLLEESGIENPSFRMIHHSNALETKLAEAIKSQLQEIGINVELIPMEITAASGSFFAEKQEPALLALWTGRPDAQMTMSNLFSKVSFFNTGSYENTEIESLLNEAQATYDQEDRAKLYHQISRKGLLEEAMFIPVIFYPQVAGMTENVQGYEANLLGKPLFADLKISE